MIVNVEQIPAKRVEIKTPFSASCKLCRTILYDDSELIYPTTGEAQTRYFYCEDCSDDEDQEISFEKKYLIKSINIELEEIN